MHAFFIWYLIIQKLIRFFLERTNDKRLGKDESGRCLTVYIDQEGSSVHLLCMSGLVCTWIGYDAKCTTVCPFSDDVHCTTVCPFSNDVSLSRGKGGFSDSPRAFCEPDCDYRRRHCTSDTLSCCEHRFISCRSNERIKP